MTKPGRNDRCPCGSGQKYKKCCLLAQARERERTAHEHLCELEREPCPHAAQHAPGACPGVGLDNGVVPFGVDGDALNELSNSALGLLRTHRFDEALVACDRLLREFPQVHDGFERFALAHDALGNHALAADFWQKTLDFAEHPDHRNDYDEHLIELWRQSRDAARQRAQHAADAEHAQRADRDCAH